MPARKTAAVAPLRAVGPDESPKPKPRAPRPKTLAQAAADGDELGMLKATRVLTAKRLADPKCSQAVFAALSRRLMELNDQIRVVEGGGSDGDNDSGQPERAGSASATPDEDWDPEAL